ncbi:hypothetical protein [Gilvimarinus algae]|uniref:Uncharacterized protein n=1 Tax=Gilvimarinus algae TaxID=3058037 RepID=A0ABT8TIH8_9GAMM|nr:hypothetical protein [Gilvimarinus sp. SDUM040014]MDO3383153.1 hypothetical protein [Gilvimarinus sp. SDUM040014]
MKPYGHIQSKNLKVMLFVARLLVFLSGVLCVLGIAYLILSAFSLNGFIAGLAVGLKIILLSLALLTASSILAAITSFEESYRIKVQYLISNN